MNEGDERPSKWLSPDDRNWLSFFDRSHPALKPLFLNLRGMSREKLVNEGGFFGQVLLLIGERHA
jgi:hypothetical protein